MKFLSLSMAVAAFFAVCTISTVIVQAALGAPSTARSIAALYERSVTASGVSASAEVSGPPRIADRSTLDQLLYSAPVFALFLERL